MKRRSLHPYFLALLVSAGAQVWADEVAVAVASNFSLPIKQIALDFEKETGHKIVSSLGSTGKFYTQIKHGAPFEVLLAADAKTPALLVSEKVAVAGTQFSYAFGKLVLWSSKAGVVDDAGEVLKLNTFDHIALADPGLSPYGAAGLEVMRALGVYGKLKDKIVLAQNISQAYQFVASGNSPVGFVAQSQVLVNGKMTGSGWVVPLHLHATIRQDAVLLNKGQGRPAAEAFLRYLRSAKATAVIQSFGYGLAP